jgi:hypothetical protein
MKQGEVKEGAQERRRGGPRCGTMRRCTGEGAGLDRGREVADSEVEEEVQRRLGLEVGEELSPD